MMTYMIPLSVIVIMRIVFSYWKNNRNEKSIEKKTIEKEVVSEELKKNWIEEWLEKNNLPLNKKEFDGTLHYRTLLVLYTCHVELRCFLEKSSGNFGANVMLPFVVDDLYFPAMNKLIHGFNIHENNFQLFLDKNEGVLNLRTEISGDRIERLTQDEKAQLFSRLFHQTDRVFKETMGMIYGGTLPELAVMKMVGVHTSMLN
jgi:hypothetical protein